MDQAGDSDAVLPSMAETERLLKLMPGAFSECRELSISCQRQRFTPSPKQKLSARPPEIRTCCLQDLKLLVWLPSITYSNSIYFIRMYNNNGQSIESYSPT